LAATVSPWQEGDAIVLHADNCRRRQAM